MNYMYQSFYYLMLSKHWLFSQIEIIQPDTIYYLDKVDLM